MTPQKKSRKDTAEKRIAEPLAYQREGVWFGYVDPKGKPMFVDKDGNPLSYAQLTPEQKLEKLDADIACNKRLQPYTKEDGALHTPCQRQRTRLQRIIAAKKKAIQEKVEKAAVSPELNEKLVKETKEKPEPRDDGKDHKTAKSGRRYM